MSEFNLTEDETLEGVYRWFAQFGPTPVDYLRAHYARFGQTRDFTLSTTAPGAVLEILDVGAHWLHNAFFYANRGHRLSLMDAPDTLGKPHVKRAAKAMGASIRPKKRMEKADGLIEMADDSVDIVLFCEVIEHLAFNPIPFWKQVYRVLRPGGRIIVTTPNAFYYRSLATHIERIKSGICIGLPVSRIMEVGTYGHHWKEFSLEELQAYYSFLSPDFDASRFKMIYRPGEEKVAVLGDMEKAVGEKVDIWAHTIFIDVVLREKSRGIGVRPPWEPS